MDFFISKYLELPPCQCSNLKEIENRYLKFERSPHQLHTECPLQILNRQNLTLEIYVKNAK